MTEILKNLRIGVEPVEVEIDDDDGILWTSIQTAFPGCSGMYYRNQAGLKSSVKFDGKKFRAPNAGSWHDHEFYVTLSQRCHSTANSSSSSYTEATRQFEKSVQAVQKMMVASGMKIDISHLSSSSHKKQKRRESSHSSTSEESSATPSTTPLSKVQERLEKKEDLTPIEQQFLDLARISTAKDEIINANRLEMRRQEERLQKLDEEMRVAGARIGAQEEELAMLRSLGVQFGESKETAQMLAKESDALQTTITELQLKLMSAQEENESLKGQLETSQNRVKEVNEQLALLTTTKDILTKELNDLRPFADAAAIDDYENIPTYIQTLQENRKLAEEMRQIQTATEMTRGAFDELQNVQTPIFEENAKLRKKNEDLERRFEHVDEEIKCLNEQWAKEMRDKQNDWQLLRTEFEHEIVNQREQIQHLQHFLEAATREAAENARRVSDVEVELAEWRKKCATIHARTENELRDKIRAMHDELGDAHKMVADLNVLVANLASDANMSRRDISDLL